jgi:hypothetical protein
MRPSAGEAYTDFIASGPAQRVDNRIRMGDDKRFTGPVGLGKEVTDCRRVRTTSLETRHAPTRRSGRMIGTVTSTTAIWTTRR